MRPIQIGMLGCVAVLCAGSALAQAPQQGRQGRQRPEGGAAGFDRGAFDPAQMQARMMERMKETLAATDEEWTVIEPRIDRKSVV